jgi:hypothetical protein
MVQNFFQISGTGPTLFGRNGEGDPYYTDGEIDVATLVVDGVKRTGPPVTLPPPPLIALKDQIWHGVRNAIGQLRMRSLRQLVPVQLRYLRKSTGGSVVDGRSLRPLFRRQRARLCGANPIKLRSIAAAETTKQHSGVSM